MNVCLITPVSAKRPGIYGFASHISKDCHITILNPILNWSLEKKSFSLRGNVFIKYIYSYFIKLQDSTITLPNINKWLKTLKNLV